MFAVKDRDPSRLEGSEKRDDQMPWSDDVLLSKSSLEDKQQQIANLESQVRISSQPGVRLSMSAGLEACSSHFNVQISSSDRGSFSRYTY